jgi:hypothetical protein
MNTDFKNKNDYYQTNPDINPYYVNNLYQAPPTIKFRNFRNAFSTYLLTWGKNLGQVANANNGLGAGGNWGQTVLSYNVYNNTTTANGNISASINFYPNVNNIYNWNIVTSSSVNVLAGTNVSANATYAINNSSLQLFNANAFPTPTTLEINTVPEDNILNPKITDLNYCWIEYRVTSASTSTTCFIQTNNMTYNNTPITVLGNSVFTYNNIVPLTSRQNFYYLPINQITGNVNINFNLVTSNQLSYATTFEGNRIQLGFGIATPLFNMICLESDTEVLMYDNTIKKIEDIVNGDKVATSDGSTSYVQFNLDRVLNMKKVKMVVFKKDSLGINIPYKDTYTTTGHYIYHNGVDTKASKMVNGTSICFIYKRISKTNTLVLKDTSKYYISNGLYSKSHKLRYKNKAFDNLYANNFYNDINVIRKHII